MLQAAQYYFNMIRFGMSGFASPQGLTESFRSRPADWPSHTRVDSFAEVDARLKNMYHWTKSGRYRRANFLGFQALNRAFWPETRTITLGLEHVAHMELRPQLESVLDPCDWDVVRYTRHFFNDLQTIRPDDVQTFVMQLLFKLTLYKNLDRTEALEFVEFRHRVYRLVALPGWLGKLAVWCSPSVMKQRTQYLDTIRRALGPGTSDTLAVSVLDTFLFAGGIALETLMCNLIGLPHTKWFQSVCTDDITADRLDQYLMEVIRMFPLVSGIRMEHDRRPVWLNLHMALNDPTIWDDPHTFRLRPMQQYRKAIHVAWARSAGTAYGCPAKDLSIQVAKGFLQSLMYHVKNDPQATLSDAWTPTNTSPEPNQMLGLSATWTRVR